jgi:cytochrome c-type biogenesis protein CcmH
VKLLAAAAAALALAAPAAACTTYASQGKLETELVCPSCHVTLDESNSAVAQEMKTYIARRIAQCATDKQIVDELVGQFGPSVLSTPRTSGFDLLAWILPLGGIALGAAAIAGGAWRWSRGRDRAGDDSSDGPALDPESERRVDEELARFDA